MAKEFSFIFKKSSFGEIICEKTGVETEKDINHFLSLYSESFALVCALSGKLTINAGADQHILEEGGALLVYPDTPLSFHAGGAFCYGYIRFNGYSVSKLARGHNCARQVQLRQEQFACIRSFFGEQNPGGPGYELNALSLVFSALAHTEEQPAEPFENRATVIERFIALTESNFNRTDFKITDACAKLGISVSYFTKLFSKTMGISPLQYVINLRMGKAKGMLKKSHLSIKEIAGYVGYDDALHFSGEFKKITGMSPSQYKRTLG